MSKPLAVREAPARYVVEAQPAIPKGYKQTEVGVIPEDWDAVTIGQCLKIRHGKNQKEVACFNGDYPILATGGEIGRASQPLYSKPSVLIGRKGTIDSPKYTETPFWTVDTLFYSEISQSANPKFLYYQFCMVDWYSYNEASGVPSLNAKTIESVLVAIPPTKDEQEAIAEALSDADALIEALEQLITKKRQLKQGAMQELLTGKRRLSGFGGEWDKRTIEQLEKAKLLQLSRGNVISKIDIERMPGDFPIYSSSVKSDGVFGNYGAYMFDEELITWSIDGGGHFFHRPRHKFSVTNVCGYMRADTAKFSFQFLAAQLQLLHSNLKFDYQDKAHPSVIRKAYLISIPSLEEQTAIATLLSDMDAEIAALEVQLTKARGIRQGMMQELLTGRIRLV